MIGKAHWTGEGMDIDLRTQCQFSVDGNMLKVLASATVTVTEQFELFVTRLS